MVEATVLFDEDRIVREIRRITELVARALMLESFSGDEDVEGALGELHRLIFGMDRDLTLRLSPASLSILLAPHQREAAITLLENEVHWLEGRGDPGGAALRRAQLEAVRAM